MTRRNWTIAATAGMVLAAVIAMGTYNRRSWHWGDFPTWVLAVGAIVTAVFATRAFGKQTQELGVLQQQAADQQALTEQQAEAIRLQASQIELQREQLKDQHEFNKKQAEVLALQAKELQASLQARDEASMQGRWDYASTIVAWPQEPGKPYSREVVFAGWVENTGTRPVRDLSVRWYLDGSPITDRDMMFACYMPTMKSAFSVRLSTEHLPAFNDGRLKAIVQFRTVGDDWWSAGTDGGLVGGMELTEP